MQGSEKILIRGGIVIDGTGAAARRANLLIEGDTIVSLTDCDPPGGPAHPARSIDARGCYVLPGIIDSHSHSDLTLLEEQGLQPKIMQGVTTEVCGQCGLSVFPLPLARQEGWRARSVIGGASYVWGWESASAWFDALRTRGLEANAVPFVGAGSARYAIAGDADVPVACSPDSPFVRLFEESFAAGAAGLSFGLIYIPAIFSRREELLAAARCAARYDRPLAVHMRSESSALAEAVRETYSLAEEAGVRLTIAHLKAIGRANRAQLDEVLEFIDTRGIAFDSSPYNFGSTTLFSIIPPWLSGGGAEAVLDTLGARETRQYLAALWSQAGCGSPARAGTGLGSAGEAPFANAPWDNLPLELGWEHIRVVSVRAGQDEDCCGKSIAEIAEERGTSPADAAIDILLASRGDVRMIDDYMDEDAVIAILRSRHGAIASDALFGARNQAQAHPRLYACFPYALRRYALEQKILPLEEAVYKMTGLPARRLGLRDRGCLLPGYKADIALFDQDFGGASEPKFPETANTSAFGLRTLFINGKMKVRESCYDSAMRPGALLLR